MVRRSVVLAMLASALTLAVCGVAAAAPAPADLDRSFGKHGSVVVEGPAGSGLRTQAPAEMALGPAGEIFVLYANTPPCVGFSECTSEWSLARYSPDGVRDPAFGVGAGSVLSVSGDEYEPADLAVGPDGKPVVAVLDGGRVVIARFDRAGHLEAMLGAGDGNPLFGNAYAPPVVVVQRNGDVIAAAGRAEELRIVRYLPGGERDLGFGSGGEILVTMGTRSRPAGLLLGADGSISVAAPQCCGGSPPYGEGIGFVRFLSNGQPDPALLGGGQTLLPTPGSRSNVEAAALAPDGGVYIAFEVESGTSATTGSVVKLRPDGSVDGSFGKKGLTRLPMLAVESLVVDGKGQLVAGGWAGSAAVSRLRPGGGVDRTFAGGVAVRLPVTGPFTSIALQGKGRIVALGEPCCGVTKAITLFRLLGGTNRTRCLGHRATIVGTGKADELTGTRHRDVIAALGGKDKVRGLAGPDLICGGKGLDSLGGGPGRDEVKQ